MWLKYFNPLVSIEGFVRRINELSIILFEKNCFILLLQLIHERNIDIFYRVTFFREPILVQIYNYIETSPSISKDWRGLLRYCNNFSFIKNLQKLPSASSNSLLLKSFENSSPLVPSLFCPSSISHLRVFM